METIAVWWWIYVSLVDRRSLAKSRGTSLGIGPTCDEHWRYCRSRGTPLAPPSSATPSKEVLPIALEEIAQAVRQRASPPFVQVDLLGRGLICLEDPFQPLGGLAAENNGIDLVVEQDTAMIEVG